MSRDCGLSNTNQRLSHGILMLPSLLFSVSLFCLLVRAALFTVAPSSGHGCLPAPPMDAAFSSLFYFFALSACACRFEVTVTTVSLTTASGRAMWFIGFDP